MAKIFFYSTQNFRKWFTNPRIYVIALLLVGYLSLIIHPIAEFASVVHLPVTPWIFPFLAVDPYSLLMIMLGIVFLFCDAPFIDAHQPYIIIRSGRKDWVFGQIMYIMLATAFYYLFIILISIVLLLPNLDFSMGWGKVLGTLAQTNAGSQFQVTLTIDYRILLTYTPLKAMVLSFLLIYLVSIFLGLFMFVINMTSRRGIGNLLATGLIFLSYFLHEVWIDVLYYISPVTWASLGSLRMVQGSFYPSLNYAVSVLIGLNLVCIVLAQLFFREKSIEVLPPV